MLKMCRNRVRSWSGGRDCAISAPRCPPDTIFEQIKGCLSFALYQGMDNHNLSAISRPLPGSPQGSSVGGDFLMHRSVTSASFIALTLLV